MADSLYKDQENKKEIDSIAALCLEQLKSIQEKHGKGISNIRSQAEKCFTKDYMVKIGLQMRRETILRFQIECC